MNPRPSCRAWLSRFDSSSEFDLKQFHRRCATDLCLRFNVEGLLLRMRTTRRAETHRLFPTNCPITTATFFFPWSSGGSHQSTQSACCSDTDYAVGDCTRRWSVWVVAMMESLSSSGSSWMLCEGRASAMLRSPCCDFQVSSSHKDVAANSFFGAHQFRCSGHCPKLEFVLQTVTGNSLTPEILYH